MVPVQQIKAPVQQNVFLCSSLCSRVIVLVQQNIVPVQQNMVPVQQNMVPAQQKRLDMPRKS
jgi:hypothetical protein